MRTPNDIKLAEQCNDIDLILGGHDHVFEVKVVNGKYVIKSGTDFRQFSKVTISFVNNGTPDVSVEEINVTSAFPEDPKLKEKLEKYTSECNYEIFESYYLTSMLCGNRYSRRKDG